MKNPQKSIHNSEKESKKIKKPDPNQELCSNRRQDKSRQQNRSIRAITFCSRSKVMLSRCLDQMPSGDADRAGAGALPSCALLVNRPGILSRSSPQQQSLADPPLLKLSIPATRESESDRTRKGGRRRQQWQRSGIWGPSDGDRRDRPRTRSEPTRERVEGVTMGERDGEEGVGWVFSMWFDRFFSRWVKKAKLKSSVNRSRLYFSNGGDISLLWRGVSAREDIERTNINPLRGGRNKRPRAMVRVPRGDPP